jgi:hypothetical protein
MTITIEPKELEHMLIFLSFTVAVIGLCYITYLFHQNNK